MQDKKFCWAKLFKGSNGSNICKIKMLKENNRDSQPIV